MRYPASEKLEIIRLVERSHLPVRRTLDKLGIPRTTFYRWYDRYLAFGEAGLEDRTSGPGRVWNRIPDDVREQIVDLACVRLARRVTRQPLLARFQELFRPAVIQALSDAFAAA